MTGHWFIRPGHTSLAKALAWDYGEDIGYLHRGDYALHLAGLELMAYGTSYIFVSGRERIHIPLQSIGRYLDGEEEREGTYR